MQKICGVDVSKLYLDAGFATGTPSARFANTAEGIDKLAAFCRQHDVTLVVMEATGGFKQLAFGLLWGAGVALLKRQAKTLGKNPGGRDRFPHQRRSALVQTR